MNSITKVVSGVCIAAMMSTAHAADDKWKFGIGTGLGTLTVDGDSGFDTRLIGPVTFDASLDSDDTRELMSAGGGIGGFAKKGNLSILYSVGFLELEDDVDATVRGITGEADITFKASGAEILVEYGIGRTGKHGFGALGGLRYIKQEYDVELAFVGPGGNAVGFDGSVDDSWIDFVFGVTHTLPLTQQWIWGSQLDYSIGDTDGTLHFSTGVAYIINPSWMTRIGYDYIDYDYENGDPGDGDWFFYDANEHGAKLSFLYMF